MSWAVERNEPAPASVRSSQTGTGLPLSWGVASRALIESSRVILVPAIPSGSQIRATTKSS